MENLLFGMEAVLKLMQIELSLLFHSQVMRGFLAGYVVATLVYGFLETSKRHHERVCEHKKEKKTPAKMSTKKHKIC